ncbi:hypothetical protein GOP47_0029546 [Adiantum capillus-veneris]|nr:hypothetical protein GOP47_0029546 [Adiantum capillus-veneris]
MYIYMYVSFYLCVYIWVGTYTRSLACSLSLSLSLSLSHAERERAGLLVFLWVFLPFIIHLDKNSLCLCHKLMLKNTHTHARPYVVGLRQYPLCMSSMARAEHGREKKKKTYRE